MSKTFHFDTKAAGLRTQQQLFAQVHFATLEKGFPKA